MKKAYYEQYKAPPNRIRQAATDRYKRNLSDWRKVFPEAAAEPPSKPIEPLVLQGIDEYGEHWWSAQYQVVKRVYSNDPVFKSQHGMIYLGISNADQTARHDWRDFQAIKNQLAGPDWEGIEIFPAEERLVDPSNLFMLFCFKLRIRVGPNERSVLMAEEAFAPQRGITTTCRVGSTQGSFGMAEDGGNA